MDEFGRIPLPVRITIAALIAKVPGKRIRLTIALYKKKRSINQNSFYFGVIVPLVRQKLNEAGNDITDKGTHKLIKQEVWRHFKSITLPDGSKREILDTSTNLTTTQWEENIEKTRAWAAEWDIFLPLPNE